MPGAHGGKKRVIDILELVFIIWITMSCYAGVGNEAWGRLVEQSELFFAKPKKHFF